VYSVYFLAWRNSSKGGTRWGKYILYI